ncbi:MAG: cell division protein FtsK [Candidatus Liptonbacteria bacterium CG11_big_fil_rev_8_21_14_0_20_35_14]|uniref:Cell division protein FtsK n=1 Tax=Candidatus Liptonbacteria bacterium CG11_big_fil_rev_8_21_14_0_20_35_14 TaxID=1974634 RepID=A0A2H0N8K6_9BACT|nr:MAG: cell division protein FtsK [Candidatus Liptonbacteria bacterium CG11_big_fil_rev_8_21_14_0_20_35_14]
MGRKKKHITNEESGGKTEWSFLHPDTKKSILAIIFFAISLIFTLSAFGSSGPAGNLMYKGLNSLFGIGYYLLPIISIIIALGLIIADQKKPVTRTLIGGFLFVVSGLGLLDIISEASGGIIGSLLGGIELAFGYTGGVIITLTIVLASLLITLNLPLQIKKKNKKEEVLNSGLTDKEIQRINKIEKENNEIEEESNEKEDDLNIKDVSNIIPTLKPIKKIDFKNYTPPPLSLLKSSNEKATAGDLRANANIIKRTFESFNIPVEMGEINIGPKVTRYTLKPAEGVKLSKIVALNQDLSLALAAHPVRIEAPIPGKSLVGIEVPNKTAATVRLRNLLEVAEFNNNELLSVILGRDVTGEPISEDISKMPHMLVAGATGSGKSVTIHTILISLLYKNSPETLRLILIDPKRVELSVYQGIPHLVAPVITQNKKAIGVFRWAINEMEKRYQILEEIGARDIMSYNEKITKKKDSEIMPFIVIVVDELADLMSSYGKEVEGYIVRIAQMARAVGIHLILATQRPSVEVITGLIKANITTRLALKVASQIDSRTIIDTAGAEKLLGGGDTLLISQKQSKPLRIQGSLVTEEEISAVTKFIRDHNQEILADMQAGETPQFEAHKEEHKNNIFDQFAEAGSEDDMLEDAIETVRIAQKASASLLQRRLKVGYARAARLLDIMEEKGIIGPGEGAKPREVYIESIGDEIEA